MAWQGARSKGLHAAQRQSELLLSRCLFQREKRFASRRMSWIERDSAPPDNGVGAGAGAEHGGGGAAEVAASHSDVAEVLKKQGRYEEAIGYYRVALEEMETIAEVDCASPVPLLASYHNNLASCLKNLGHRCVPMALSPLASPRATRSRLRGSDLPN